MLFAALFLCLSLCSGLEFPSEIPRCKVGDVKCIAKIANMVVRKYPKGNPAFGLPPLDPFVYNKTLDLSPNTSRMIKLDLKVKNTKVYGLSQQDFQRVVGYEKDPTKSKFELYGQMPKLEFRGEYSASGKLLAVPLNGNGNYVLRLEDIDAGVKFKPRVEVKGGKQYVRIQKIKVRLEAKKVSIKLDNLYSGNRALGDPINDVLNQNIKRVWTEMYPRAMNTAETIMKEIIDKIFAQFAYEDIFLK